MESTTSIQFTPAYNQITSPKVPPNAPNNSGKKIPNKMNETLYVLSNIRRRNNNILPNI